MTLEEMVKAHEGLRLLPYLDTEDKLTIGYGRNLEDVGVSISEAEQMLANDLSNARKGADVAFPWFKALDPVRQDVIVMMSFNMGISKLSDFHQMIQAIKAGNYLEAAEEMRDSLWARQVRNRSIVLCGMMRSGKYPEGE